MEKSHNNKIEMKNLGNPLKMNEIMSRLLRLWVTFACSESYAWKQTFRGNFSLNLIFRHIKLNGTILTDVGGDIASSAQQ